MTPLSELGLYLMLAGMAGAAAIALYVYWRTRK